MNHIPRWIVPQREATQHVRGHQQETGQPRLHSSHRFICKDLWKHQNRQRHGVSSLLLWKESPNRGRRLQKTEGLVVSLHRFECSRGLKLLLMEEGPPDRWTAWEGVWKSACLRKNCEAYCSLFMFVYKTLLSFSHTSCQKLVWTHPSTGANIKTWLLHMHSFT